MRPGGPLRAELEVLADVLILLTGVGFVPTGYERAFKHPYIELGKLPLCDVTSLWPRLMHALGGATNPTTCLPERPVESRVRITEGCIDCDATVAFGEIKVIVGARFEGQIPF